MVNRLIKVGNIWSLHPRQSDYKDLVAFFHGFVSAFFINWTQIILTRPLSYVLYGLYGSKHGYKHPKVG